MNHSVAVVGDGSYVVGDPNNLNGSNSFIFGDNNEVNTTGGGGTAGRRIRLKVERSWTLFAPAAACALLAGWIALTAANFRDKVPHHDQQPFP